VFERAAAAAGVGSNETNAEEDPVLLAVYEYDGKHRRIRKIFYTEEKLRDEKTGELVTSRVEDYRLDVYFNTQWQTLEIRKDGDTDPLKQYAWCERYIDAPILRWRDSNTDGTVDDTLYYTNDANMNVTAMVDQSTGSPVERYHYDPYGKPTFYTGAWALVGGTGTASAYDNEILYCGYRYDPETGLYRVRNRYLHDRLGWIGRDGELYAEAMNLYLYCLDSPLGRTDWLGLESEDTKPKDKEKPAATKAQREAAQKAVEKIVKELTEGLLAGKSDLSTLARAAVKSGCWKEGNIEVYLDESPNVESGSYNETASGGTIRINAKAALPGNNGTRDLKAEIKSTLTHEMVHASDCKRMFNKEKEGDKETCLGNMIRETRAYWFAEGSCKDTLDGCKGACRKAWRSSRNLCWRVEYADSYDEETSREGLKLDTGYSKYIEKRFAERLTEDQWERKSCSKQDVPPDTGMDNAAYYVYLCEKACQKGANLNMSEEELKELEKTMPQLKNEERYPWLYSKRQPIENAEEVLSP
jgi:RHS repeat-associated protein